MILFSFNQYQHISDKLLHPHVSTVGEFKVSRYANGELYVKTQTSVAGEHCAILGTIQPPDENLLSFLLLAHTLKKEGASRITAVLPYLAYSRHDKEHRGESMATAWLGSVLKTSGIDDILTIDIHSAHDQALFPIPINSLSSAPLFGEYIKTFGLLNATLIAPDNGAIPRCKALQTYLGKVAGMPEEIPYFKKQRTEKGIENTGPFGQVGTRVILVDDILDTGATLISACKKLGESGAHEIYGMCTHGIFSGSAWQQLWDLGVIAIVCTDTVMQPKTILKTKRVARLSVIPLLQEALYKFSFEKS